MTSIVIFIKYPAPGKVKTRLGAKIGYGLAAELYKIFMEQTFELAQSISCENMMVAFEPKERKKEIREMVPQEFQLFAQEGADLGQRLIQAFRTAFSHGMKRVIILGSDSPTLPGKFVSDAINYLRNEDLVLGPSEDGGYYLIALKQPHESLFENIEWSSDSVLQSTIKMANQLGLKFTLLPQWYDVDDLATLIRAAKDDESGRIEFLLEKHPKVLYRNK